MKIVLNLPPALLSQVNDDYQVLLVVWDEHQVPSGHYKGMLAGNISILSDVVVPVDVDHLDQVFCIGD